jgi:hypothetical protein
MAQFTGTWQINGSTGFDDYMKAIGKIFMGTLDYTRFDGNCFQMKGCV